MSGTPALADRDKTTRGEAWFFVCAWRVLVSVYCDASASHLVPNPKTPTRGEALTARGLGCKMAVYDARGAAVTFEQLLNSADRLTVVLVLALLLWAGTRGLWVYGAYHRETVARLERALEQVTRERDKLLEILLQNADVAEQLQSIAGGALTLAREKKEERTNK